MRKFLHTSVLGALLGNAFVAFVAAIEREVAANAAYYPSTWQRMGWLLYGLWMLKLVDYLLTEDGASA